MTCTVTLHKKNTLMSLFYYVFSMWLWPKFEGDPLTENIRFSPGEVQKLSNDLQKNDGRGHVALKTKITIFKQEDHDGPAPSWKAAGASKQNWIYTVITLVPQFINKIKVMVQIVLNLSCEQWNSHKWPCDPGNEVKVTHVLCKSGLSWGQPPCASSRVKLKYISSYPVNNNICVSGPMTLGMGSRSLINCLRLVVIKDK